MGMLYGLHGAGIWNDNRGENFIDTGSHYYNVYETSDRKFVAVGSIESKFYAELVRLTGLEGEKLPQQNDRAAWSEMQERLTAIFKTKTRDHIMPIPTQHRF
jgi:alpha-methylacyl-CoA racemase